MSYAREFLDANCTTVSKLIFSVVRGDTEHLLVAFSVMAVIFTS